MTNKIQVHTSQLLASKPTAEEQEKIWKQLKLFLHDMDIDKSSFYHLPKTTTWLKELEQNQPLLNKRLPKKITSILHLGIGGSSLGTEALIRALAKPNCPNFYFLDNIDPDWITDILTQIEPKSTIVYVVSKSGSTMETLAQFAYLYEWLAKFVDQPQDHFIFCTDPHKGDLRTLSHNWHAPVFQIPPNLGGRFSVLSAVGLFPASLANINHEELEQGAFDFYNDLNKQLQKHDLPEVALLAFHLIQHYIKNQRNITVLMPYSQKLKPLSAWFTQLWAESLGKKLQGLTPIPATGATDQHSILQLLQDGPHDKVVGFIEVLKFQNELQLSWKHSPALQSIENVTGISLNTLMNAEFHATRQALTNNKRPHFTISVPELSAYTLGQLFYFFECLTAMAGYFLEINPFDQPGVEEGKKIAQTMIKACKSNLS